MSLSSHAYRRALARCSSTALFVLLAPGCAPLSPAIPLHTMETTEVLPARKFSFGFVAGGGGLAQEGSGGGAALRVRAGVGAQQEVGVEGAVLYVDTGTPRSTGPRWTGQNTAYGMRLSWKMAPLPFLATLAGLGAASAPTGTSLSPDLGVLVSPGRLLLDRFRPYTAVRGVFSFPVGRDINLNGGVTASLVVPAGLMYQPSRSLRLFLEGGAFLTGSSLGAVADPVPTEMPPLAASHNRVYGPSLHGGGYGAVGVVFLLERNTDSESYLRMLQHFR